jgi:hypothetical protein
MFGNEWPILSRIVAIPLARLSLSRGSDRDAEVRVAGIEFDELVVARERDRKILGIV